MLKTKFATLTPQDPKCQILSHIFITILWGLLSLMKIEIDQFVSETQAFDTQKVSFTGADLCMRPLGLEKDNSTTSNYACHYLFV